MKHIPGINDRLAKRPTLAWALVFSYAALIYSVSSMSRPPQPMASNDAFACEALATLGHFMEYMVFGFLLYAAFRSLGGRFDKKAVWLAIIAATIYGLTDEIHQSFVPNRDCSIIDLSADFLGASIGAFTSRPGKRPKAAFLAPAYKL
ncbi:MAG: VanZ family protein [Candidatus Altiarchaeota archaeon]|nr:VanZ family protein [Candidatus Altiarchaeota archaeon]